MVMKKLTDEQVADIRRLYEEGFSDEDLAEEYGVSRSYIWALVTGNARKGPRKELVNLSIEDGDEIRRLWHEEKMQPKAIARKYNITPSYAERIIKGEALNPHRPRMSPKARLKIQPTHHVKDNMELLLY